MSAPRPEDVQAAMAALGWRTYEHLSHGPRGRAWSFTAPNFESSDGSWKTQQEAHDAMGATFLGALDASRKLLAAYTAAQPVAEAAYTVDDALDTASAALLAVRDTFRRYQALHLGKSPPDIGKASKNAALAALADAALRTVLRAVADREARAAREKAKDDLIELLADGPAYGCGCSGAPCQCNSAESVKAWVESLIDTAREIREGKPAKPEAAWPVEIRDRVIAQLGADLGDTYDCTRVWSAWGVGTMSEDDFVPVEQRIGEIADGVLQVLAAAGVAGVVGVG